MCGKIWDYYWLEKGHTMDKNNEYVCTLYWQLRQTQNKNQKFKFKLKINGDTDCDNHFH